MSRPVALWRIYGDLLIARMLLGVAPGAAAKLSPEDHRFLAERYGQLATRWRAVGWRRRADVLDVKAQGHIDAAGGDDLPPAASMGLPRPFPRIPIDARGRVLSGRWTSPTNRPRSLHTPR